MYSVRRRRQRPCCFWHREGGQSASQPLSQHPEYVANRIEAAVPHLDFHDHSEEPKTPADFHDFAHEAAVAASSSSSFRKRFIC